MRTSIIIIALSLCLHGLNAQPRSIVQAEYFIDTDPGFGLANQIALSSNTVITASLSVSAGGISTGFHHLFVRAKDSEGKWGITETRPFYIRDSTQALQQPSMPAIASEYFIDSDPGPGLGIHVNTNDTVAVQIQAGSTNLGVGFHYFFLRARNQNGVWGITESRPFYVRDSAQALQVPSSPVAAVEYFIDSDPGPGQGGSIEAGDTVNILTQVATANLVSGFHYFFTRAKNPNGSWGITESRPFHIRADTTIVFTPSFIVRLEFFYNTEPGVGSAIPISISQPSDTFYANLSLATAGLDTGTHKLVFRALDSQNKWGISELRTFNVKNFPLAQIVPSILSFGNVKLGQFKDTTITITNTGNDTLKVTNITSSNTTFSVRPTVLNIPAGATFSDTVRFTPFVLGAVLGTIVLTSNAASSPDTIHVSAYGIGSASVQYSSKTISFGRVNVGRSKDTTVIISNTGNDTLKITSVTSSKPTFGARPISRNIPPGQSFADTLRFSPGAIGPDSAIVLVSSNAHSLPDTIRVSGMGDPPTSVVQLPGIPTEYSLSQNYPNPFNPSTVIHYEIPRASQVSIKVFNILGQLVDVLLDQQQDAGYYRVHWRPNLPNAVYFYRMQAEEFVQTRKLLLLR